VIDVTGNVLQLGNLGSNEHFWDEGVKLFAGPTAEPESLIRNAAKLCAKAQNMKDVKVKLNQVLETHREDSDNVCLRSKH